MTMRRFKIFLGIVLLILMVSCSEKSELSYVGAEIEYEAWGEEIIWNDLEEVVTLTIIDMYDGTIINGGPEPLKPLVVDIPAGASITLMMPSFGYFRCVHTAVRVTVSGDGFEDVVLLPDSAFFDTYDLEEKDYYATIDGHTFLEDDKWPVYTYHITKEILGIE